MMGYDVALEKERLAFEQRKWEAQMEADKQVREAQLALEREKLAAQERQLTLEREKFSFEQRRIADEARERVDNTERELRIRRDQEAWDRERFESRAVKLKQFGDALRSSMSKMSENSPLDFLPFINTLERRFGEIRVPDELKVSLMLPYLSDKCRTLVHRLQGTDASSYAFVKQYLLEQLRLVPSYFIEEFNRINRQGNETYKSFIARLTMLLTYYIESRKVHSVEQLTELIIADRVKAVLSEGSLSHVLRCETTLESQWANCTQLADILDTYSGNYDRNDRPKSSGLCSLFNRGGGQFNKGPSRPDNSTNVNAGKLSNTQTLLANNSSGKASSNQGNGQGSVQGLKCYRCGNFGHIRKSCPELVPMTTRKEQPGDQKKSSGSAARVNRCGVVRTSAAQSSEVQQGTTTKHSSGPGEAQARAATHDVKTPGPDVETAREPTADDVIQCARMTATDTEGGAAAPVADSPGKAGGSQLVHGPTGAGSLHLAALEYVEVSIQNWDSPVRALIDSGSQVNVINSHLCDKLELIAVGQALVKGFVGPPISAEIVKVTIKLWNNAGNTATDRHVNNDDAGYITVLCASCDNLNEDLILTLPAADQLFVASKDIDKAGACNVVTRFQSKQ
jgi:hypothetical protein